MAPGFPLYIDLCGNNCTIFGGGPLAASRAVALLAFGAKVTVISPTLCDALREMDRSGAVRYIPRRYYRGDCTSCYLCVAATDDEAVNIAISDECKAKAIAVNVTAPSAFGTFQFPTVLMEQGVTVSVAGDADDEVLRRVRDRIAQALPDLVELSSDGSGRED